MGKNNKTNHTRTINQSDAKELAAPLRSKQSDKFILDNSSTILSQKFFNNHPTEGPKFEKLIKYAEKTIGKILQIDMKTGLIIGRQGIAIYNIKRYLQSFDQDITPKNGSVN